MEGVVPEAPYFPCGGPNFYDQSGYPSDTGDFGP